VDDEHYHNKSDKGPKFLLVDAQLSKKIIEHHSEFVKFEIFEILNNALKI